MGWAGMKRSVDFQGFRFFGTPSGCQTSTSESCKFAGVVLTSRFEHKHVPGWKNLKEYSWPSLGCKIHLFSVPAWKRTSPPKPPTSTCTTRVVCSMTSPSGWSAPASWGSTASPLTSRTALWPLGHTSTSVSVHKRSAAVLVRGDKTWIVKVWFNAVLQLTTWCWLPAPRLQRYSTSPWKCPRLRPNGSWWISRSLRSASR